MSVKKDSRQARRFGVQIPITFRCEETNRNGIVLNLSAHGCAMTTDQLPAMPAYISLVMDLQAGTEPVDVELAGVRWVSDYRCGLEFIRLSGESARRLSEFVALLEQTP
jgi:hypothetical protein